MHLVVEIPKFKKVLDLLCHSIKFKLHFWHLFIGSLNSRLAMRDHHCLPLASIIMLWEVQFIGDGIVPGKGLWHCACDVRSS